MEFDVLEREARYRCHARFETQGFRHGARHPEGNRYTLFPTALGAGATEPSGRRERHGSYHAGDDDEQKFIQDLKWRHLAGLIGRTEISNKKISARRGRPAASK